MVATAIDLFCGAGGMSAGLIEAGFRVLGAVDAWEVACKTYTANFDHPILSADLSKVTGSQLMAAFSPYGAAPDLVAGGPPCQGFSIQRIGEDQDNRNNLVLEFGRLVSELKPKMFLMENVPGLKGKRGQGFATQFESVLTDAGYRVRSVLVNAAEYGIPQLRRRVFYYGWLSGKVHRFSFPTPTHSEKQFHTVWDAIGNLPSPPSATDQEADQLHRRMRLSALNLERLQHIPPGKGFESLPINLRVDCHKNGASKIGHRNVYGRLAADEPANTITGRFDSFTRGKFAHPFEHRNITLREGARLQTFSDNFGFQGSQEEIAAMIGNAVPPKLAAIVAKAILANLQLPVPAGSSVEGSEASDQMQLLELA